LGNENILVRKNTGTHVLFTNCTVISFDANLPTFPMMALIIIKFICFVYKKRHAQKNSMTTKTGVVTLISSYSTPKMTTEIDANSIGIQVNTKR